MWASHSYGKYSLFSWTTLLLSFSRKSLNSAPKSSLANDHYNSTRATARRPPREASQIQSVAGVWWRGRREDTGYEEDESFVERGQCRNHSCEVVRLSAFFCDGGVPISHHPPLLLPSFAHVAPLRQKLYLTSYIQRICLVLRIGNARTNLFVSNSDLFGWKLWVVRGGSSKSKDSNLAVRVNYLYW